MTHWRVRIPHLMNRPVVRALTVTVTTAAASIALLLVYADQLTRPRSL